MGLASLHAAEKPNILIILIDDIGYSDIGCYGGEIETPNLEWSDYSGKHGNLTSPRMIKQRNGKKKKPSKKQSSLALGHLHECFDLFRGAGVEHILPPQPAFSCLRDTLPDVMQLRS